MSKQYDNRNSGVLFKNDRKEKSGHPDYKGKINIDGKDFWLAAWIKEGPKGKFMSLSPTPVEGREPSRDPAPRSGSTNRLVDELSDDIPFMMEWR